ncbi:leucine-rich repeat extensin-like protein 6 [Pyrus ussuriensis x Pyrus communis]|uniref:Leucine-rich repeat extensin-like protein 6 n=1 Tax=Pyrus ussuriensis x Pyrus communis TaxID=2448454 RepID=A0A5N5EWI7_9ROSA|nr:leucine-rich repeat extensin-like protein 6 [Pyrus ussuriensis x Pyrus communis]
MSDPINWYQSQRSTAALWFGPVDPTLPAPWTSVIDDSSGMVFYWNPETNVSQYEHPKPPPPHPPPDHYHIPFEYKPTFPSSDPTYLPPDYPASYMPELHVAPSYTSPIFLPHPAPPSVMY